MFRLDFLMDFSIHSDAPRHTKLITACPMSWIISSCTCGGSLAVSLEGAGTDRAGVISSPTTLTHAAIPLATNAPSPKRRLQARFRSSTYSRSISYCSVSTAADSECLPSTAMVNAVFFSRPLELALGFGDALERKTFSESA